MANGAEFWEVPVTASHANPSPAGTCAAVSCAGEAGKSFPAHTGAEAQMEHSARRPGRAALANEQSDRSAFPLG